MNKFVKLAACAIGIASLGACGGEDRGADGLTEEERAKLNAHAENFQDQEVVDTSPDSMVLENEWIEAEANAAGTDNAENGTAPNTQ
ncbi:hypothetical protein [Allosphingosinicella sp.]|jgi:hypothetical protein|uniref:hypothetical protein n=1 Tax=Allosphingosinicella sp. TaxID=2823234 RepID=UPI002EE4D916